MPNPKTIKPGPKSPRKTYETRLLIMVPESEASPTSTLAWATNKSDGKIATFTKTRDAVRWLMDAKYIGRYSIVQVRRKGTAVLKTVEQYNI